MSFEVAKLKDSPDNNIVVLIDSQAAILLLINSKYNENANVHSCRIKLFELKNSQESNALQWIPSHYCIFGNNQIW